MTGWRRVLLWVVLGASLMANAVTLGFILRVDAIRDEIAGGGERWTSLPAETRTAFRAELIENRRELRALLSDLGAARSAMLAAGIARPYDRAAVEAAQARVRAASQALQARAHALMLNAFDAAAAQNP